MLDPKVFKAYDVRGMYPTELDEQGAHAIGRAYVEHFEPKQIAKAAIEPAAEPGSGRAPRLELSDRAENPERRPDRPPGVVLVPRRID